MTRIAIAGNPNAGKTSIFNNLTGSNQRVSNYPGVTVERKEGVARLDGQALTIIDLPGTYSLTAYSQEEIVARNVLIDERPDVVIDVVDASNLERNLYLAVQLLEMNAPLVIALNMVDVARKRGFLINVPLLSQLLGAPVVATVGNRGEGMGELLAAAVAVANRPAQPADRRSPVSYGHEVDEVVDELAARVAAEPAFAGRQPARWLAVKLIEDDEEVRGRLTADDPAAAGRLQAAAREAARRIEKHCDDDAATVIAERRYGIAAGAFKEAVALSGQARQDLTDLIDTVLCNRLFGPVALVGVVTALFFFVFKLSDEWAWIPWFVEGGWISPTGLMEWLFESLAGLVGGLEASAPLLHSLVADAIIGGVGGVMGFVPLIFFMFLFVAALEDTGYIARVAFITDRLLRAFGLQGKSILAMIVSGGLGAGGCAVPGVMATRTLREDRDRLVTMLVVPFMNCGAKMPVYAMLIAAFFAGGRTRVMLALWALSWAFALACAWLLRRFVVRGEQTPFVMELPPYHIPTVRGVLTHTWERVWMYVRKAGTIILAANIALWGFMTFPRLGADALPPTASAEERAAAALSHSVAGRVGTVIEPVTRLAGFDWQVNIALLGGWAAKEVVVGSLGTIYSMGDVDPGEAESLSARLRADAGWYPLRAFTMMVFVMLYAPCLVTLAAIRRESGSWKWAVFSTVYSTALAFVVAVIIFQCGHLLGLGVTTV